MRRVTLPAIVVKAMERELRKEGCVFNGTERSRSSTAGEGGALMGEFYGFLESIPRKGRGSPLLLCNFLERLDEAADYHGIFSALAETGRQVFIAIPAAHAVKVPEELPCVTFICT